ncbi:glucose-1-phosphate thymidylyltransferase [Streptomyces avermitilis]|uniref:Glucose-1-phosphate thymidylyltransferase n=4 Tax=Bacteria TaxID=2 RepID=Q79ZM2_STRAW|nr:MULTISPECIES: glucose-1-phosphate thymidylyltransferase RfbA [Streptomyces]AGO88727.1 glucose-1-phosphate thymidyltransferase [Streptomyces coelicolor]KUN47000.1 glucose-1-phosphate thymidylyltransferase [Streptomyces avermitilis]MYS96586.1 glucose-1-phosphate thymidylyltransferase RfbA [Streptomyces sp. SID5469]BAA84594.1 glucose-1-phosphate thymidyltransferase [Streptomyces avermitilis]BAC68657.1 glucose-1-phosphate thymidyltransferase [Streptomyces avermitilis MA-4680 = NBRC 14893]
MKGIVLAGGTGSRLYPLTRALSKQLLPVYDKPMIYYPLSVLMLGGIKDILVISSPDHLEQFRRLLGDGSRLGLNIDYAAQQRPGGIAEAFLIGADFIGQDQVSLVLGDNIFHGMGFSHLLRSHTRDVDGCVLFGYAVTDPERYGVGEVDASGKLLSVEEKPTAPRSNLAITGLYLYDNDVIEVARGIRSSARGELEITDVNRAYLAEGRARLVDLGRGFTWLDAGTHDSLMHAGQYVQVLEKRQGVRIACLEEIAFRMGLIDADDCYLRGVELAGSGYGEYLMSIAAEAAVRSPGCAYS